MTVSRRSVKVAIGPRDKSQRAFKRIVRRLRYGLRGRDLKASCFLPPEDTTNWTGCCGKNRHGEGFAVGILVGGVVGVRVGVGEALGVGIRVATIVKASVFVAAM